MTDRGLSTPFARRSFLKAGGAMVIGFAVTPPSVAGQLANAPAGVGQPDPDRLDSWIAIHSDNTATILIGHKELGQGISTTLLQIAAEELDLEMSQVKSLPLETGVTPNQGATVASAGIARGGVRIRQAAADARQALLSMASARLAAPVEQLSVASGVVSVAGDAARSVSYGQLVGDRRFDIPFTGRAPIKDYRLHKVVGTRVPRVDIPAKAAGTYRYLQQLRVPGMLHGRVVRPRGQGSHGHGAPVRSVDETSIRDIPGVRIVRRRDFVGVVAPDEWNAVKAAARLRITWDLPAVLPASSDDLYERMYTAQTVDRVILDRGDVTSAFASAAQVVSGRYHSPYQAHATFAPNCALADVKADSALIACASQAMYGTRARLAELLKMRSEQVTLRYVESSGTFGRSCYDDAAQAAAIMSQDVGAPVRVQFMRWDEIGWEPYQAAHIGEVKVACDAAGMIVGYQYDGWQHGTAQVEPTLHLSGDRPPGEGEGIRAAGASPFIAGDMYALPHWRIVTHRIPGMSGYLRSAQLRSPFDIAVAFASEQAVDELAFMMNKDPYLFRRQNINGERWLSVLDAVAKAANWTPRPAASTRQTGRVRRGRGIGLGTHLSSYGAAVAEIDVDVETGIVVAKHMYGAIDAGQVINPAIVESQIVGQMCHAASRMLKEEVKFSTTNVTSTDWATYPMLRFNEAPEVTAIAIRRQDVSASGAGEEALAAGAVAIANAFFDAVGVRLHECPLTPARVLAALKRA